ncbi:hypothetical protein [Pseudomonas coleopterorum]|uniref:hypothetical protein n=1 Tax=Pseudomonas coleopterorum TaxID=1605838 RepID=UPI001780BA9A|nr:hypothetical protein [Pseudomonas coleopterorum]MBD8479828.1 hypothetical protein [Pseudomonas coleopterorum]
MISLITNATDRAATVLAQQNVEMTNSALHEVMAGCLGYESYALLAQDEESYAEDEPLLPSPEAFVLNLRLGAERAVRTCGDTEPYLNACLQGIGYACGVLSERTPVNKDSERRQANVYLGFEDFYYRHAQAVVRRRLIEDHPQGSSFSILKPLNNGAAQVLWSDSKRWVLTCEATCTLESQASQAVYCIVTYAKVGRAGLVFQGYKSILEIVESPRLTLAIYRPDGILIDRDGSPRSPKAAVLYDCQSKMVLGAEIGASEDAIHLAMRVLTNEFGERGEGGSATHFRFGRPEGLIVEVDSGDMNDSLKEMGKRLNVSVQPSIRRQKGGQVERIFGSLNGRSPLSWSDHHSGYHYHMTLEIQQVRTLLKAALVRHNSTVSDSGRTPSDLWARQYHQRG